MTCTPTTPTRTGARAGLDLLGELRTLEAQWRRLRAGYTDEDGELRPEHYRDYDEARGDHGIDLADRLENWIERLAAALEAPEPAFNTATLDPARPGPDPEPGTPANPHA